MPDAFTQVPPDSTGDKVRTWQRTVGADTVAEQVVRVGRRVAPESSWRATSGLLTPVSAQAATAGLLWLVNQAGSTRDVCVRAVDVEAVVNAAAATFSRLLVERVSASGTPTGASITPSPKETGGTSLPSTVSIRTASTGLTITANTGIKSWTQPASIGAVWAINAELSSWRPDSDDDCWILKAGETLQFRTPDTDAAVAGRRVVVDLFFDVYDPALL